MAEEDRAVIAWIRAGIYFRMRHVVLAIPPVLLAAQWVHKCDFVLKPVQGLFACVFGKWQLPPCLQGYRLSGQTGREHRDAAGTCERRHLILANKWFVKKQRLERDARPPDCKGPTHVLPQPPDSQIALAGGSSHVASIGFDPPHVSAA
jgi:predicted membrane metal-binding protein